jgi:hypothetical protein
MDYTGRQFERLTVIKDLGIRDLLCRCQCGNVKIVQRSKLENGHTKSCGCFRIERARLGVRKRYPDAGYRRAYSAKKSFAKIRRIGFKLTFEQFKSVIVQDCHYCGKPPVKTQTAFTKSTTLLLAVFLAMSEKAIAFTKTIRDGFLQKITILN